MKLPPRSRSGGGDRIPEILPLSSSQSLSTTQEQSPFPVSTPKVSFWTLRYVYTSMSVYVYVCTHVCAGAHEWGGQMSKRNVFLSCSIFLFETRYPLYRALLWANLSSSSSDQLGPLAKDQLGLTACWHAPKEGQGQVMEPPPEYPLIPPN